MKRVKILLVAFVSILFLSNCAKQSDNKDIIPLAVGNTWIYSVNNNGEEFTVEWTLTEKKPTTIILLDETEITKDVFIRKAIHKNHIGEVIRTSHDGYYKENDGIVLVANYEDNKAQYVGKILNDIQKDWIDSLSYVERKCLGKEKKEIDNKTYDCIKYSLKNNANISYAYFNSDVGLVYIEETSTNWSLKLVSYDLK